MSKTGGPRTTPTKCTVPPVRRVYQCIRDKVDGRILLPGDQLPSTRDLSKRLRVARNTVMAAYDMLLAEGHAIARPGAGTFVAPRTRNPIDPPKVGALQPALGPWGRRLPEEARVLRESRCRLDFRPGSPSTVGLRASGKLMRRALRKLSKWNVRDPAINDPAGHPRVRELLANHLRLTHGFACGADDLVLTNGTQQAFDLVGRLFAAENRVIALEEPGYPPAAVCFASLGFSIAPVPVDKDGIIVSKIPRNAALIYTTPNRQFPLGYRLSMARRRALLSHAATTGAYVIEDDYDGEMHNFEGRPARLKALDGHSRVIYVTSVSKYLIPQLRFGCIVAPVELRALLVRAKWLTDRQVSLLTQSIIEALLQRGVLSRIIRRADRDHVNRHHALRTAVERMLSPWFTATDSSPGMHLTALAAPDVDVDALIAAAASRDVGLYSLRPFCRTSPLHGLLFGLSALSIEEIVDGIAILRELLQDCDNRPPELEPLSAQHGLSLDHRPLHPDAL